VVCHVRHDIERYGSVVSLAKIALPLLLTTRCWALSPVPAIVYLAVTSGVPLTVTIGAGGAAGTGGSSGAGNGGSGVIIIEEIYA